MPLPVSQMPLYIQEADRRGDNGIGCEHLFLGILANEKNAAASVLAQHGVNLGLARHRVDDILGEDSAWAESQRWTFSPRATLVMRLADVEAERLGHVLPTDVHMMLALLTEGRGTPITILIECGVSLDALREHLVDALEVSGEDRTTYLRQRAAYEHAKQQRLS